LLKLRSHPLSWKQEHKSELAGSGQDERLRFGPEKARGDGGCEPDAVSESASGRRRVVRGWITIALGCGALVAPLLIGDWASLFLLACAPMGVFIVTVGMVEVVRGAKRQTARGSKFRRRSARGAVGEPFRRFRREVL
jgi:hypothetical protein